MLIDNDTVANILYWDAYQKAGLIESNLSLTTPPLYKFIGDHLILRGTIKLAVTVGDQP